MAARYTAALVGLGNIAWRFDQDGSGGSPRTHLGAYQRRGVDVVCGYSPVEAERQAFEDRTGIRSCATLDEIWAARPDIVSICSPSEFHHEQAAACLAHRIPLVWLEKPPTLTLPDLDDLIERQTTSGTRILVNYMRRYSARYRRLAEIPRGEFGKPLALQVQYSRGLETNGSHFLDVMFMLRGDDEDPTVCVPDAERVAPSPSFVLRFSDGFIVSFSGHDASYHINDVVLACETGRVSLVSGGADVRVERKVPSEGFPGYFRLAPESDRLFNETQDDAFGEALADLIDAHVSRREPLSSLRTSRQTQAVISAIRNA